MSGFGIFSVGSGPRRVGWLRGDLVLDLDAAGLGDDFAAPALNPLMGRGRGAWEAALERIDALGDGAPAFASSDVELHLPFEVADFVDFYSSIEHATNVGRIFRPDTEPLLPNWRWLPVGYHGSAGTVVVSGSDVFRPCGQWLEAGASTPS